MTMNAALRFEQEIIRPYGDVVRLEDNTGRPEMWLSSKYPNQLFINSPSEKAWSQSTSTDLPEWDRRLELSDLSVAAARLGRTFHEIGHMVNRHPRFWKVTDIGLRFGFRKATTQDRLHRVWQHELQAIQVETMLCERFGIPVKEIFVFPTIVDTVLHFLKRDYGPKPITALNGEIVHTTAGFEMPVAREIAVYYQETGVTFDEFQWTWDHFVLDELKPMMPDFREKHRLFRQGLLTRWTIPKTSSPSVLASTGKVI